MATPHLTDEIRLRNTLEPQDLEFIQTWICDAEDILLGILILLEHIENNDVNALRAATYLLYRMKDSVDLLNTSIGSIEEVTFVKEETH